MKKIKNTNRLKNNKKTKAALKELTNYRIQQRIQEENQYISNLLNGQYYLARSNMIAEQLNSGDIKELIDGCTKTTEYFIAEYRLMKMQAIKAMSTAHASKENLIKDFGMSDKDISELENNAYAGKIIRDEYSVSQTKPKKADFVQA